MSLDRHTPVPEPGAAYTALARLQRSTLPKVLYISYDRTRVPTRNPQTRQLYTQKLSMYGLASPQGDFPASVVFQNGEYYSSLDELKSHYYSVGTFELKQWDEESKQWINVE